MKADSCLKMKICPIIFMNLLIGGNPLFKAAAIGV